MDRFTHNILEIVLFQFFISHIAGFPLSLHFFVSVAVCRSELMRVSLASFHFVVCTNCIAGQVIDMPRNGVINSASGSSINSNSNKN